jgi:hypothetical protein
MAATIAPPSAPPAAARSLPGRFVGVLTSPRATYAAVAANPRWLGILCTILLITIGASMAFFSTEVGRQAVVDQQIRTMEGFGRTINDDQYQRLQQMAPYAPYLTAAGQLIALPTAALIISAIAVAIFSAALGGDATFKQVFSIVAHSGALIALQQCFVQPLDYARETLSSPTNLGVFLPFLDENTFVPRLLGVIDLFLIWWIVSLSIGLGVLYKRRTQPIAVGMLTVYAVLALAIAMIKTIASGSSGV